MKPSELLRSKGWCQGALALDAQGGTVQPGDPNAVAHCMVGSYWAVYRTSLFGATGTSSDMVRYKLAHHLGIRLGDLTKWNDDPKRTKDEVIAALEAVGE